MDYLKMLFKGLKQFGISFLVIIVTGISTALAGFAPEPGIGLYIWGAVSAFVIGGVNAFLNWLKNKNN